MSSINDKVEKYNALCHAMQTGVKFKREYEGDGETSSTGPKHLRVGVNTAMVEHGALVALLIEKGLFTEEEYVDKLVLYMEKEVETYQKEVSKHMGIPSTKVELK